MNDLVISRGEISTEIAKMQLAKSLVVIFCILRLNLAAVKSCIEEHKKDKICFKSIDGINTTYLAPYPLVLNTTMILKEIIEINEKESSIAVRVILVTKWKDPGIGLSNGTTG